MLTRFFLLAVVLLAAGCASVTPEEIAERRIAAVRCEHEGGKAYHTPTIYNNFECVSAREQQRLEKLELACVSAGGTPIYHFNDKYKNCYQRGPDQININNTNNNSSSSTIKRY